jgi:dienelactone hydrolase
MKKLGFLIAVGFLLAVPAHAAIQTQAFEYTQGGVTLEGFLAYDDASLAKRPGVLIVHEWRGISNYEKKRATKLAQRGYVAFVADIYGKGVRPATHEEAAKVSGLYKSDRGLMRERVKAGLDVLKNHALVDDTRTAAIGYCFGGTSVLELARSGEDVLGVVSFHGSLQNPKPEDAANIRCKVLVLHGAKDPFVKPEEVHAFEDEMRKFCPTFWQVTSYGLAVHGFTNAANGTDPSKGAAYDADADRLSWQAMRGFLKEVFGETS